MKVVLGIRFLSWNPAFQLEKRIPGQSPEKGGRDEGCLGGIRHSSSKSGSPANLLKRGAVMKVVLGIRFSSWNPAFQLEKRIPGQSPEKGGRDEGCLGDPLFELESGTPARKRTPGQSPEKGGRDEGCGATGPRSTASPSRK